MKKLLYIGLLSLSSQAFAKWDVSLLYGMLMSTNGDQAWSVIKDNSGDAVNGGESYSSGKKTFALGNTNFLDLALSSSESNFGIMYSASLAGVKFSPREIVHNNDKFLWQYNGYYVTYKKTLSDVVGLDLAVGRVKQKLKNTEIQNAESSSWDFGGRFGLSANYNLSNVSKIKFGIAFQYFKDFNKKYNSGVEFTSTNVGNSVSSAEPKFNSSGLVFSMSWAYNGLY